MKALSGISILLWVLIFLIVAGWTEEKQPSLDAEACVNRGLAMKKLGNMKKACSDWKRACELGDCRYWRIVHKVRCLGKL